MAFGRRSYFSAVDGFKNGAGSCGAWGRDLLPETFFSILILAGPGGGHRTDDGGIAPRK